MEKNRSGKVSNRSTLDWAEFYLSKGFSIIPLRPREKMPAIPWTEYQKRKPTLKELNSWFGKGNKNIGIVTGSVSGIVVIDLDSEVAKKYALEKGFPNTPSVKTAKGCHLYYKHPIDIEVRNFQKRDDLPNIDLRGNGGYVVAPPSIHSSGSAYEWIAGKGIDDLPLAELPDGILVRREYKTPIKDLFAGMPEGKRNDSLFRICMNFKNNGLILEDCLSFAHLWNERNNPPLSYDEVERTVRGIFNRYSDPKSVFQFPSPIYSYKTKKLDLNSFDCFKVTVTLKIPRLVSDDVISQVKEKLEANKTWSHGQLKNKYLLGRMIFCDRCGYALVGAEFHGRLYYRHQGYRKCGAFGSIRADDIEDNAFNTIFENFGDTASISESIKNALPDLNKIKLLHQHMDILTRDKQNLESQRNRLIDAISDGTITKEDVSNKMAMIKNNEALLSEKILQIEKQLNSLPTEKQITRSAQLLHQTLSSYYRSDARKEDMTFEDKRKLLQDIFAQKTADGKRAGIFITHNKNLRSPWRYEIKGTLSLDSLHGTFKKVNLNFIDKNNPGNSEDTGYYSS